LSFINIQHLLSHPIKFLGFWKYLIKDFIILHSYKYINTFCAKPVLLYVKANLHAYSQLINLPCRVVVRFSRIHLCDGLSSRFLKKL
jgi:hypothetical protein